ncbi:hypothetical protein Taro_049747 [Colocasia esculenta]|uniref:Uncharacterized protein n=1 Tax=Colocasia esculenta TaxID=4460 RepID=A0A843XC26_COLES|nr:hypothetical protein [Colocasia esculenta]
MASSTGKGYKGKACWDELTMPELASRAKKESPTPSDSIGETVTQESTRRRDPKDASLMAMEEVPPNTGLVKGICTRQGPLRVFFTRTAETDVDQLERSQLVHVSTKWQGHGALQPPLLTAGCRALCVFGFGVPLFVDSSNTTSRVKWGLWIVLKLLLAAVYGILLFMHHTKWRERLPARPIFYKYISAMFLVNAIALLACGLVANGAGFGFWLYNLTVICYHSLYPPLLYITFLADFFQEEDMNLENVYYSEMKDAGFFDADWD